MPNHHTSSVGQHQEASHPSKLQAHPSPAFPEGLPPVGTTAAMLAATTVLALLLLGYHPYAEDGGIYAAAVQGWLHPDLFPHDRIWITAHTRFALFVPLAAVVVRTSHLSTETTLFLLHAAGLTALLAATRHLAQSCFPSQRHPWFAALAIACAAGLPVAGTGLYAVDPYCTARSLTTPLLLLAVSFALRRRWIACALCWAVAASLHPLMAIWGALPILFLAVLATRHPRRWTLALTAAVLLAAALLFVIAAQETSFTYAVAQTRGYWFPAEWRWYEWAGAIAPCALLAWFARRTDRTSTSPMQALAFTAIATSLLATAIAVLFAREHASSLAVARLQPMRGLHLVFVAFLTAGAAYLQSRLKNIPQTLLAIAGCIAIAASSLAMQRSLYSHTAHLELPNRTPSNPWESAFAWCRDHTPPSALFALDSNYIDQHGEDSHGFRAIALRSTLPDNVKDAGIAAVLPALTPAWQAGVNATTSLNTLPDAERRNRLFPLGVTWIVLPAKASTSLSCPFHNAAAKVCQLH